MTLGNRRKSCRLNNKHGKGISVNRRRENVGSISEVTYPRFLGRSPEKKHNIEY